MLDCLFWHAPSPVSVATLAAFRWQGEDAAECHNRVHVYMGYLRKKLQQSQRVVIRMRRGGGYEFVERSNRCLSTTEFT